MMKYLLLISLIFLAFVGVKAQDCYATCRSHGTTIQAWIKPTQANLTWAANSSIQLLVVFSLPANGATNVNNAPMPTGFSTTIGSGSPSLLTLFLYNGRYNYLCSYLTNVTPATTWNVNTEHMGMGITFGNGVIGTLPRIDNLLNSGGGLPPGSTPYYFFEVNGELKSSTEDPMPFYTTNGMTGTYGSPFFDQYVQPLLPLPIKLLSFNAEKGGDNKSSILKWSNASESNSSYFSIERSLDKINWKTVGKINAAGNSQIITNYEFLDKNVNVGSQSNLIVYYRLKMVDRDDSFEYSSIESVNFGNGRDVVPEENEFLVYPNPASEGIHVEWDSDIADQPTQLEFYDISGKLIHVEKVADQTNEQYVDFTKANFQSGLCLMRIMSGDKPIQYKQIVVGQDH